MPPKINKIDLYDKYPALKELIESSEFINYRDETGSISKKRKLTSQQKDKITQAESLAIVRENSIDSLRNEELKILFNPEELKHFYLYMNYQTVGVDKETNTIYYYITDVIAFIKGLAPLD